MEYLPDSYILPHRPPSKQGGIIMSTKIRPAISKKRTYYISKHRYYELKHFCLQYNEWRNLVFSRGQNLMKSFEFRGRKQKEFEDPVGEEAGRLEWAKKNMKMVEDAAACTDDILGDYIFEAVTQDRSYTYLKMVEDMPGGRDHFYICYHKFFWVLSQLKHAS